jgi:hypothetical protein
MSFLNRSNQVQTNTVPVRGNRGFLSRLVNPGRPSTTANITGTNNTRKTGIGMGRTGNTGIGTRKTGAGLGAGTGAGLGMGRRRNRGFGLGNRNRRHG